MAFLLPEEPVIHIDDSDVVKPDGYKFEALGIVMDRGYDDNKIFLKLDSLGMDYVIRLTTKRKLFFHGKWVPATQLRNQRKVKIKTTLIYKGKSHDACYQ